jgi:hypothetical protein
MLARRIQVQEDSTIRRMVDAMPWPEDVKGYHVEFGEDRGERSSGSGLVPRVQSVFDDWSRIRITPTPRWP